MEDKIKKLFEELDDAIYECLMEKPIPFNESKFKYKYEEIKRKWLNGI